MSQQPGRAEWLAVLGFIVLLLLVFVGGVGMILTLEAMGR